ncbi:hypothetical protein BJY24_004716 [Nocardia transvalensis]|uniref:Uncharacterized protein n=1 Tax=Nocardia transvalensis TaxID=37333 RepID=A0A7W9PGM5_9NOCA|nr:hypothetical protein [Nocardia transvalensis]MBB5915804.1 hypothetical protein [Nocardia transvalensis]
MQGIDLDTGQVEDQNQPGADVSPSNSADLLNAMSDGAARFAPPAEQADAPNAYSRCRAVPSGSWAKTFPNLPSRHIGDIVCVRTDQSNLSALTLTHIPSAAERYVEFDFITWQDR